LMSGVFSYNLEIESRLTFCQFLAHRNSSHLLILLVSTNIYATHIM
jgi:hypothetical protein